MPIEIQQTWWHIEEIYFPTNGRKIRQIMDIFTDQPELKIDSLENCYFVGLKVFARNCGNKEIPFLERKDGNKFSIILNLDPLSDYPLVPPTFLSSTCMHHIKLEIEYILTEIEIINFDYRKIHDKLIPKRYSSQEIEGEIQPEFYLTLPLGWRVSGTREGDAVKLRCTIERNTPISTGATNTQQIIGTNLELEEPFIKSHKDGARVYNYLIDYEGFEEIKAMMVDNDKVKFKLSYTAQLCYQIIGISLFRYVLGLFSCGIIIFALFHIFWHTPFVFDTNFGMAFLIVLMGFSYYYGNLVYLGYEIPHYNRYIIIFIICLISIFLIFLIPILTPLKQILMGCSYYLSYIFN